MLPFRRFPLAELQRAQRRAALFETVFNYIHFHVYRGAWSAPGRSSCSGTWSRPRPTSRCRPTSRSTSRPRRVMLEFDLRRRRAVAGAGRIARGGLRPAARGDARPSRRRARGRGPARRARAAPARAGLERHRRRLAGDATSPIAGSRRRAARRPGGAGGGPRRDARLTYGELDARANRLARRLRAPRRRAGGPGRRSACERSPELVGGAARGARRRAAPTCRSIPPTRRSAWPCCSRTPGAAVLLAERAASRPPCRSRRARCSVLDERRRGRARPGACRRRAAVSAANLGLRDLHLRLDRPAQGGRGRHTARSPTWSAGISRAYGTGPGDRATPRRRARLRRLGLGDLAAARRGRQPAPGRTRRSAPTPAGWPPGWRRERDHPVLPADARSPRPSCRGLASPSGRSGARCGSCSPAGTACAVRPRAGAAVRPAQPYGPTEATVVRDLAQGGAAARKPASERPAPDRPADREHAVYVLDARPASRCRSASPGELCIGGAGLARGYLGRPELTAERFVPDPFGRAAGRAALPHRRPGALAAGRRRSSSSAASTTRSRCAASASSWARSRRRSLRHPAVREARGGGARGRAGRRAGWSPTSSPRRAGAPEALAELRAFLRRAAAGVHGARRASCVLDALPLTPNGKVDRRALPRARRRPRRRAGGRTWRRARRSRSCSPAIWARGAGRRRGSASHDDFFELGGHSLLATQLVSRLREAFGVELPLRALFEAPTVAGAGRGGRRALRAAARRPPAPPLAPVPRERRRCRSPSPSSGSGSSTSSSRAAPAYNIPAAVRLAGALDAAALGARASPRSCAATRRCAPRFAGGRRPSRCRSIAPRRSRSPLPLVDLRGAAAGGARGRVPAPGARGGAAARSTSPRGPLLRAALLRLGGRASTCCC